MDSEALLVTYHVGSGYVNILQSAFRHKSVIGENKVSKSTATGLKLTI